MSKQKHFKIPIPKWTPWQITRAIVLVILAIKIEITAEIISFLKALLKLWSG